MASAELAVIGGGVVGMALACGLLRNGLKVTVFDGGDSDLRASRGNFGLIWVQGKGDTLPDYARWTRQSAALWPDFADTLHQATGIDLQLSQRGGMYICLDQEELDQRKRMLQALREKLAGDYPFEVMDRPALARYIPAIGPEVAGATFCAEDGHVNPLSLLRALHTFFERFGGRLINGVHIEDIQTRNGVFRLTSGRESWKSDKLVLAAGLGNLSLAPKVGLEIPLRPNRGQVMIGERVPPFLHYPTGHVRQTAEGTVQLGDSQEDVGFDDGTTPEVMAAIARRAVRMFPQLAGVRVIRAWGALRILSKDGYPVYQESAQCPGAYVVTCHSGVTLAASHEGPLADWIAGTANPPGLQVFSGERFYV
ncbi:MAG: FAD-binding oxidoreductase [Gammaproteobacteria bacterium]|nr:FAD-binding oxidoreductase [Gammaproteobacteria bacterium]